MKYKFVKALSLFAACGLSLMAAEQATQPSLNGMWQWKFTMPDGGEVSPRVRFKTKDDHLSGTSRFRAGSETPLTNIVLKGNDVSFDVVRKYEGETVTTHYSGKLNGDSIKGRITSHAGGEEQTYDWDAKRLIGIDGAWRLYVDYGSDWPDESRLTLKQEGERVTGKLRGRRGETDIHHGRFKDGRLSFEVERPAFGGAEKSTNRYHGRLTNDALAGKVEMNRFGRSGRQTNDWDAVRAD
jgi:hypothetical protein